MGFLKNLEASALKNQSEKGSNCLIRVKTHLGAYEELKSCSVDKIYVKNLKLNNYCLTELNEKQKEILKRLGATTVANVNTLLKRFRENYARHRLSL